MDRCIKAALTAALAVAASVRLQRSGQYPSAQMRRRSAPLFNLRSSEMAAAENNFCPPLPQIINVSGSLWALRAKARQILQPVPKEIMKYVYMCHIFEWTLHMPDAKCQHLSLVVKL